MPKKCAEFYNQLIEWVEELNIDAVIMDLRLKYISSTSSKKLLEILKGLENNSNIKRIKDNWYYEAENDDILERGQFYEDLIGRGILLFREITEV
ncbi:MAG: SiaC family regulatory phosphoprotein [Bacteroidales bacterium]|nr:SiaC family regulatory phosphoprotein [Bacteroidales bacterium]